MKKLVKRRRSFRVNNPLAFGILCAMILIFIAGITYALASGVIAPIVRSVQLANATPTPTATVAPATPTPTPAPDEETAGPADPAAETPEPGASPTPDPAALPLAGHIIGVDPARGYSSKIKGISTEIYANRLNYAVATLVKEKLEAEGAKVVMGLDDVKQDRESSERASIMNTGDVELAVRIECNYLADSDTQGAIVWLPDGHAKQAECDKLGSYVLESYIDATNLSIAKFNGATLRKKADDTFLMSVSAPVCTIVTGYISNAEEDRKLNTAAFQNNMADGIVAGIKKYLGVMQES